LETETATIKSILLVDDDPQDVKLTLAALKQDSLADRVGVVKNGAEALDYLYRRGKFKDRAGGNPILVLLDNKMPKVSGLQVLKIMKADELLKKIPVVVLTSSREESDLHEFYKHGVNAYVVKPVGFVEFMAAVKKLGVFWAAVNEPPTTKCEEKEVQEDRTVLPEKGETENEITDSHPALGG
jgi:CheY-like chemotaxis protein